MAFLKRFKLFFELNGLIILLFVKREEREVQIVWAEADLERTIASKEISKDSDVDP